MFFSLFLFFTSLCTLSLLLSVPPERSKQERARCTLRCRRNPTLRAVLRDSLRSNRSSHRLRHRTQSLHFFAASFAIATIINYQLPSAIMLTLGKVETVSLCTRLLATFAIATNIE